MASARKWNSGPIAGGGGLRWKGREDDDDDDDSGGDARDTTSEHGAGSRLSEQLDNSLSLGKDSPKSQSHKSIHSDDVDDTADSAVSDWNSETGGSTTFKNHAYQASISSDEGLHPSGQSKRTLKPRGMGKPVSGELTEKRTLTRARGFAPQLMPHREIPPLGFARGGGDSSDNSSTFPSSSSNARQQDSDQFSPGHWTESESSSSGFTPSSGGRNYRGFPPEHPRAATNFMENQCESKRMEDIREQRLKAQFQNMDGMRTSVRSNPESSWSSGLDNRGQPAQTPHCCLHCRSDICPAFKFLPAGNCCDNGRCRSCSHCCCYPSTASGRRCHAYPGPRPRRWSASYDSQAGTPTGRDNSMTKKRFVGAVYGASSFILCYGCSALIQLPPDFNFIGQRRNKIRCGSCSTVVVFLLAHGNRIVPSHSTSVPSHVNPADPAPADAYSSPSESNRRGKDEDYGSTEYETDSSEGLKAKKKRNPFALHKVMGYFSARDNSRQ